MKKYTVLPAAANSLMVSSSERAVEESSPDVLLTLNRDTERAHNENTVWRGREREKERDRQRESVRFIEEDEGRISQQLVRNVHPLPLSCTTDQSHLTYTTTDEYTYSVLS
jgi:hypothetical protein